MYTNLAYSFLSLLPFLLSFLPSSHTRWLMDWTDDLDVCIAKIRSVLITRYLVLIKIVNTQL